MQNHDNDRPSEDAPRPDFGAIASEQEDFGGRFGYGRPAHKPDPAARYGFEPQDRTMPRRLNPQR